MIRFLLSRIGCMMMIFGIIVLAVGFAAVQSQQPALSYLALGAGGTVFGYLLWNKLRERPPSSNRFSLLRKRDRHKENEQNDRWEDRFNE